MRDPCLRDLCVPTAPAPALPEPAPGEVELLVFGAPGLLGPAVFVFENEPAARDFAGTLRRAWPRAQVILAPHSGQVGTPGMALRAVG